MSTVYFETLELSAVEKLTRENVEWLIYELADYASIKPFTWNRFILNVRPILQDLPENAEQKVMDLAKSFGLIL